MDQMDTFLDVFAIFFFSIAAVSLTILLIAVVKSFVDDWRRG